MNYSTPAACSKQESQLIHLPLKFLVFIIYFAIFFLFLLLWNSVPSQTWHRSSLSLYTRPFRNLFVNLLSPLFSSLQNKLFPSFFRAPHFLFLTDCWYASYRLPVTVPHTRLRVQWPILSRPLKRDEYYYARK